MLKAIVLDFDGVIVESAAIKTRAFSTLFSDYPEHVERIVRFHQDNGGISRYEKFEIIYRDYLRLSLNEDEKDRLGKKFSALVFQEMLSCSYVPGALDFLKQKGTTLPLFLVSGTPETELQEIVARRQLDSYFREVRGFPHSKSAALGEILTFHGWKSSEAMFVGDSLSDFRAANSVGMPFIGRVPAGEPSPFPTVVRWIVPDLQSLLTSWDTIVNQLP